LVDRAACVPVPDGLDSEIAAAIGVVGTGAELALAQADLKPDESVLVLEATDPFGNAFVQLAKQALAERVIAAARHPDRLAQHADADGVAVLGDKSLPEQRNTVGGPVDLVGVGVGLMGPAMGAAVFAALPPERGGMAAGAMTTFRQLGQTLGVAVFGVLFQQSGTALPEGLNRVLTAAAAAGIIGSVLVYIFVPKQTAANASVPARRNLTSSR
jgi:NADPH:quinone reductase-like Zn-dependent oxidoreductase